MKKLLILLLAILCSTSLKAKEPKSCQTVRLSDIGWTDVTSTTAVAAEILRILGYTPETSLVSVPVTLAGLKNNDLDLFLGNWMPAQEAYIKPYLADGTIVQLTENLKGAVYTLAVPDYVYKQGVTSFADLKTNAARFKHEIYGIEPGNDGNRLILKLISDNAFGLKDFNLIESSEQAMLVHVKESFAKKDFVVFLAWAPHPMNRSIKLNYLTGGDEYFGPNLGASQVFTVTRKGFALDCQNLGRLFKRMKFSVSMENQIMASILEEGLSPELAAKRFLGNNEAIAKKWLHGIKTWDGKDGVLAFAKRDAQDEKSTTIKFGQKAPIGHWFESGLHIITSNFAADFRGFADFVEEIIAGVEHAVLGLHWGLVIAIFCALSFLFHHSVKLMLFTLGGMLLIVNLGLWNETMKTLILVVFASSFSFAIGFPVGVIAARHPWFYALLRPLLDLMQTIPTFVYLIPSLMLFGLGLVPGLISTIIFAIAAPIRFTHLGISKVPYELKEASTALGATNLQTLLKVEIPCALPSLMAGLTQCVMLALSMVVIAALVGADGLGTPVVRALNTVNIELGFEAGLAIVIIAIWLDQSLTFTETS